METKLKFDLGSFGNLNPGHKAYRDVELTCFSLVIAVVIASTHCAYPRMDGQAELALVAGYTARCISTVQRKPIITILIVVRMFCRLQSRNVQESGVCLLAVGSRRNATCTSTRTQQQPSTDRVHRSECRRCQRHCLATANSEQYRPNTHTHKQEYNTLFPV